VRPALFDQDVDVVVALGQGDHLVAVGNVYCLDFPLCGRYPREASALILEIGGCAGSEHEITPSRASRRAISAQSLWGAG